MWTKHSPKYDFLEIYEIFNVTNGKNLSCYLRRFLPSGQSTTCNTNEKCLQEMHNGRAYPEIGYLLGKVSSFLIYPLNADNAMYLPWLLISIIGFHSYTLLFVSNMQNIMPCSLDSSLICNAKHKEKWTNWPTNRKNLGLRLEKWKSKIRVLVVLG